LNALTMPLPASQPATVLVRVAGLSVTFGSGATAAAAVRGVSFTLEAGRILALVGESGSGKSVTARTLLGLSGPGATVTAERLEIEGQSVLGDTERAWRARRGGQVGLVLQDALVSLDPLRSVGAEIREVLDAHGIGRRASRPERVITALREAGLPEPERRAGQRSGQLSGGQRQRALIAAAIAAHPRILIADEPTTALDATVQRQILMLLRSIAERGSAILLITHDLGVVSEIADDVAVMKDGQIVEFGRTEAVLHRPRHAYTRALLAAVPAGKSKGQRLSSAPVVSAVPGFRHRARQGWDEATAGVAGQVAIAVESITKIYRPSRGISVKAVDAVSFRVGYGRTLGLVGESGAGKSSIARILLGLEEPDTGTVTLLGQRWSGLTTAQRRPLRSSLQMVYQDPLSSFDPRWDVDQILRDALSSIGLDDKTKARKRALELLDIVGLQAKHLSASPLQLSGGQRQRVAIARALAPEPAVLLCDEPVSALDASTQAQVLDLLLDIQKEFQLTYVFISHDLSVIYHVSDDILVLKDGKAVEYGAAETIYRTPSDPYTHALFASVARIGRASALPDNAGASS
jgi:peptide/nickel transport system ATP-binding protein